MSGIILPNGGSNISTPQNPLGMQQINLAELITQISAKTAVDIFERMTVSGIKIKYKKVSDDAIEPTYGTKLSAGADLYSTVDVEIQPHTTEKVDTGLAFELPDGFAGFIFARSGLATKQGLRPANCVGVIDSDYTGNVIVALHNDTDEIKSINKGDRIAQMIVMPAHHMDLELVEELTTTERGDGGFGSTGN